MKETFDFAHAIHYRFMCKVITV